MAILTKTEKYVAETYAKYFGRAADADTIKAYGLKENGKAEKASVILRNIIDEADHETIGLSTEEFVNNAFQNLFGRNATTKEMNKYAKVVDAGKDLPINAIVKSAKKSDKAVYDNKIAVANKYAELGGKRDLDLSKISKGNLITDIKTVTTSADLKSKIDALPENSNVPSAFDGKTFMLTASANNFVGTEKGDVFNAYEEFTFVGPRDSLTGIDTLDGGAGKDFLNVKSDSAITVVNATISNIETINLESGADVTFDTTTYTDVETLNATKGTSADLTAAATTDVNVSGITGDTSVTGGKTVTVTQNMNVDADTDTINADTDNSMLTVDGAVNVTIVANKSLNYTTDSGTGKDLGIVVGDTTAVTGAVKITSTGAALKGNDGATLLDNITVNGGTTVNITQVAAASYGDSASKNAGGNDEVTQGDITVVATTDTTTVTIKQDAAVAKANAVNTTGAVTETASVKFGALKSGDKLTIEVAGGTANTVDTGEFTLTAVKDMSATEVAAAFANLINGSAYGSLIAAGDTQSGAAFTKGTYTGLDTLWTSAAASGDTVVFTSNTANNTVADIDFLLTNTSTNSVAPIVTTTQGKANDATMAGGVTGIVAGVVDITADTALTTVTVDSYGATSNINGAAAALATINLKNGAAFTVSDTADTVTLTLEKVTGDVTFTAEPKTLNVKSIGDNTGVVASANTTAFNVSGTGTLTQTGSLAAVKNITVTETAGLNLTSATLSALESIDATATTGAVTASISGTQTTYAGSKGVDTVTVSNASTKIAKAIDLGAGNDKLILAGGTVLVPTVELKGGEGTDTLSIDATSAATHGAGVLFAGKVTGFEKLELTAATTNNVNVEKLGNYNYVISNSATGTVAALTITDLANNGTLEIANAGNSTQTNTSHVVAIKDAATGAADNLNIVLNNTGAVSSTLAAGTVTAANVETVKVTTTDATPTTVATPIAPAVANINTNSMELTADKATALTIDGNAGLNLTLNSSTDKLVTIDASKMTAALTLDLTAHNGVAMTVNAGSGADVLKASIGATAKADILVGGAGNDTLFAGSNGAHLTGGEGNDLFVLSANATGFGTKEATTHSYITDFKAGDLLQLKYFVLDTDSSTAGNQSDNLSVTSFSKLAANQSANAVYTDYVNAAMAQMNDGTAGDAVWFSFAGNSYVIVDSGAASTGTFKNGEDLAIELTGVANLNGASFNTDFGTIAL